MDTKQLFETIKAGFARASHILDFKAENGHQGEASLCTFNTPDMLALDRFKVIEGAAPSYNNWRDVDRLLQTITHIAAVFDKNYEHVPYIAVGCKHGNPCGAAVGDSPGEALQKMMAGDSTAIFGGSIMTNFALDEITAANLKGKLLDAIIVPDINAPAIQLLKRKETGKCRFIVNEALETIGLDSLDFSPRFSHIRGGVLCQQNYTFVIDLKSADVTRYRPAATRDQERDMLLAWAVCATSNSNTITIVKNGMLIGNGVGQQDRWAAAELAVTRAERSKHSVKGAVACSDSFFPFADGPQVLIDAGVKAILTTSGSVNDKLTIDVCENNGIALLMIPDAIGRLFFGH